MTAARPSNSRRGLSSTIPYPGHTTEKASSFNGTTRRPVGTWYFCRSKVTASYCRYSIHPRMNYAGSCLLIAAGWLTFPLKKNILGFLYGHSRIRIASCGASRLQEPPRVIHFGRPMAENSSTATCMPRSSWQSRSRRPTSLSLVLREFCSMTAISGILLTGVPTTSHQMDNTSSWWRRWIRLPGGSL